MGAFVDDRLLHTGQTIEDDGACTTPNIVDRGIPKNRTGGHRAGQPVNVIESVGHGDDGGGVRGREEMDDVKSKLLRKDEVGS